MSPHSFSRSDHVGGGGVPATCAAKGHVQTHMVWAMMVAHVYIFYTSVSKDEQEQADHM